MSIRLLSFLLACLSVSSVWGQNPLFVPFGQEKVEVRSYLESRDYTQRVLENDTMQTLLAVINRQEQAEYVFDRNKLYAITYIHHYTDLKAASAGKKNFLEYMKKTGALEIGVTRDKDKGITCHTGLNPTRVLKLFVRKHEGGVTLTIASISRFHGPRIQKEDFFYERELLEKGLTARAKN